MSELSKVKLQVSGETKKTQNGNEQLMKKIYRKVAVKQTNDVGKLSLNVGNNQAVNAGTKVKPKLQHRTLNTSKEAVKNLITQPILKSSTQKSSAKKNLATKQLIKIQKPQSNKQSPGVKNPNSITINKVETKKMKPVKRVLKAIPMAAMLPRDTESHRTDKKKLTNPAEKQPIKVKRVLRKKLKSTLNVKTTRPKTVGSMTIENVLPYTTKQLPS